MRPAFSPRSPAVSRAGKGILERECESSPALKLRRNCMRLETALSEYEKTVAAWLDQAKRQVSAVQRLQKMVADGNLRDLERARQVARNAATVALERAEVCEPLAFDTAAYLS